MRELQPVDQEFLNTEATEIVLVAFGGKNQRHDFICWLRNSGWEIWRMPQFDPDDNTPEYAIRPYGFGARLTDE